MILREDYHTIRLQDEDRDVSKETSMWINIYPR